MNKRIILATGILALGIGISTYVYCTVQQVEEECKMIRIARQNRYGAEYGGMDFHRYMQLSQKHTKCIEPGRVFKCTLSLGEKLK